MGNSELPSQDPLTLPATTHSLMSSRTAWVSLPLATSPLLDLSRLVSSELLLRPLPCHPANTLEDPRTFQVVTMDLLEPSQEDTHSRHRSKTPKPVTELLMLRSRTDVPLCLELPVP